MTTKAKSGETAEARVLEWRPPEHSMARLLGCAKIPTRYTPCTRSSWASLGRVDPWPALDAWLDEWAEHGARPPAERAEAPPPPWSVTILGPVGAGKTHLATALAVEWMERGVLRDALGRRTVAWWYDVGDVLEQLRASFAAPSGTGASGAHQLRARLAGSQLVVFDDLLRDRLTDWSHSEIVGALNRRYSDVHPTIVTTNAEAIEEIDRRLDPRIGSRLCEGLIVKLTGRDRRR